MNQPACKDCYYFLQHYTLIDGKLISVHCGHCRNNKPRSKRPNNSACKYFVPGTPVTEQFVRKEFLTKRLLEHVLNMPLLPVIGKESDE